MDPHELKLAHRALAEIFVAQVLPAYRRIRAAMGSTFAVCGFGASNVPETSEAYQAARRFAARMAREGIPVVAGGPYTVGGRGRGIQHALHEGAHEVEPRMSIGCELLVPAWGEPEIIPCEPNLRNPDLLVTRLPTMLTLSSCFVAFGRAAFGTDLERAVVAQLLWLVRSVSAGGVPEGVFPGHAALRCGFVPKLILVGDAYDYVRQKVASWAEAGLIPEDAGRDERSVYTFVRDERAAEELVLSERQRFRDTLCLAARASAS